MSTSQQSVRIATKGTRVLGIASLAAVVILALLGLVWSPEDSEMGDVVRVMYVHVPSAWIAYAAFTITAVGSAMVLFKRSMWWDIVASSSAEIGVVFCTLALVTGAIWGRPTWGTYWEWGDARIVTTMVLLLMYVGYLALRRAAGADESGARRAAVVGLVAAANIPIVHMSVRWWSNRTLHQEATVLSPDLDPKLDDLQLFSLMFGLLTFSLIFGWMLLHRFRIGWLERDVEQRGLADALAERRAEGRARAEFVFKGQQ